METSDVHLASRPHSTNTFQHSSVFRYGLAARITTWEGDKLRPLSTKLPGLGQLYLADEPVIPQRYHVEIWAEKSTQNDILVPLVQRYGANLVTGVGEMSLTACDALVRRAGKSGRPVRILYVSDFDPAGLSMPVASARKIEFGIRDAGLDHHIQLRPVVLTLEQCQQYSLPRTPLKPKERRADLFEYRYGTGATELDALEALHPGTLEQIVEAELDRYWDPDLEGDVQDKIEKCRKVNRYLTRRIAAEHQDELDELQATYASIVEAYNAGIVEVAERLRDVQRAIQYDLEVYAPKRIKWPESVEGDDDDNPMFDSSRGYLEQVRCFKRHQQKDVVRPKVEMPDAIYEGLGISKSGVPEPTGKMRR
jgi:hypothetical protein